MSLILKMLSKFDDSGIKKAKHSFSGLKSAIGAIGIGIGVSQVTNLLIDSAKAASADAKSTLLLNTQLEKNAKATKTQIKQADKFVEKLSLQTGILDDDLRPSFGKLARATKDTSKAQDLLKLSLDAATVSGKPLDSVASAMAKAFNGNTTSLIKLFPELKKSKDLFGDLKTEVEGAAVQQADPFMKFNNSIDILKEKLGAVVLPLIVDFVTEMTKPGGIVETVGKFFEQLSNPKTKPGKMFVDIKNAVKDAFGYVKDFFALFGNGDAMKGFGNVAGALVKMLPALIALKGIMMLANAGKSIANLVKAMVLIQGKNSLPTGGSPSAVVGAGGKTLLTKLTSVPVVGTVAAILTTSGDTKLPTQAALDARTTKSTVVGQNFIPNSNVDFSGKPANKNVNPLTTYNITVNATNADPKAVVNAVSQYVKTNGGVPSAWGIPKGTAMHYGGH